MKTATKFFGLGLGFALSLAAGGCSGGGGSGTTQPGAGVGNSFTLVSVKWGRLVDVYDKDNAFFGKLVINESQTSTSQLTLSTNALTGHNDLKVLNFAMDESGFNGILNSASNQLSTTVIKGPTDTFGFSMIPRNAGVRLQFSKQIDPPTLNPNTVKLRTGSPPNPPQGIPFDLGTLELDPRDSSAVIVSGVVLSPENIALGINLNPTGFPASSDNVNATLRISFPNVETPFTGQNEILRDVEGKPLIAADNPVDAVNGEIARLFRTGGSFDSNAGFVSDSVNPQILGSQDVTVTAVSAVGAQSQISFTYDTSFCSSLQPRVSDLVLQGAASGSVVSVIDAASTTKVVVVEVIAGTFATGAADFKTFFDESLHTGIEPCFVDVSPAPVLTGSAGSYTVTVGADAVFSLEFSEPVNSATVLPFRTMALTNQDDGNPSTQSIFNAPTNSAAPGYKWNNFVVGSIDPSPDLKSFRFSPLLPLAKNNVALNPRTYDLHIVQGAVGIRDFAGNELDISSNFLLLNIKVSSASSTFTTEARTFRFKASNMNEDGDTGNVSEATAAGGGFSHCSLSTDLDGGVTGRNATPYSRIVDDTQSFVKVMNVTQSGLQTPLVPLGAKMKTLWRYHDIFGGQIPPGEGGGAGPGVTDEDTWHVSVVGMSWAPFGGNVFPDKFGHFKALLGHSLYAPINRVNPADNTTAQWQHTGFNDSATGGKNQFKNNALETANFDVGVAGTTNAGKAGMNLPEMTVVFDGEYTIQPAALYNAGVHSFLPYPEFQNSFIWRNLTYVESAGVNTGIPFLGGGKATGGTEYSDSQEFTKAGFTPSQVWKLNTIEAAGTGGPTRSLPSISLPLCAEFRCFPNSEAGFNASGINGFHTSFMFNTNQGGIQNPQPNYPLKPSTRMFSQGYFDQNLGQVNPVSPESSASNALAPSGGWCPINCAPTGTAPATQTTGFDPVIYWKVFNLQNIESVFFSSWVDTGDASTVYGGFVIEPAKVDLPSGTDIIVEFRGFTPGVGPCAITPQVNASRLDPYGNCDGGIPGTGGFFSGNPPTVPSTYPCTGGGQPTANNSCGLTAWTTDVTTLNGKRWFQMRVRLVANSVTNIVPTLKGIGVTWN